MTKHILNQKSIMTYLCYQSLNNNSKDNIIETLKKMWRGIQFNEWTFTLFLLIFSSSIILGKLFLNYDSFIYLDINTNLLITLTTNRSYYLFNEVVKTHVEPLNSYSWIMKAIFSGLTTIGITWFIIYKDSNVPGINPVSPFSPLKERIKESHSLQINYFVGILNGLLIFIYMCL